MPPILKNVARGKPGRDFLFGVVLLVLAALTALWWLADPAHRPDGKSRVPWPELAAGKP